MSFPGEHAARLRAYLDAGSPPQPWTTDRTGMLRLAFGAALLALACALAVGIAGYHAGFGVVNAFGRNLPPMLLHDLTYLGHSVSVLVATLIFGARRRDVLWTGFIAGLLGTALSHAPKQLFAASRPPAVIDALQLFLTGPKWTANSFPSGHTVSIFVGAGLVLYFARHWAWWIAALGLAALVGASRVLVGVHWPVDVLAGASLGLASVAIAVVLANRMQRFATFPVQVVQASLLAGCAVALWLPPNYPLAAIESMLIGAAGLCAYAWHYAIAPWRR
jgi:membrane-associated phospholipid phosphatase